jgi:hypothetical protein
MFCVCPPPTLFPTAFQSYVFLFFSAYVHPYVLSIWRAISSLLFPLLFQDHLLLTDLATSCVKNDMKK